MSSFDWGSSTTSPDASQTTKGLIKLSGDLSGTSNSPEVKDLTISGEQVGSLIYFNGTNWVQLTPGTALQVLKSGSSPYWSNPYTKGSSNLNFGSIPGGNYAEVTITGQTGISSSSKIEVWLQSDSTSTHNEIEHQMLLLESSITFGNIINNVGFTIYAFSYLRLTGEFKVNWSWS